MAQVVFKKWSLKDCEVVTGKDMKAGDMVCLKWNFNKPGLEDCRFYYLVDIHRGFYFLITEQGEEYANKIHPDKQALVVANL